MPTPPVRARRRQAGFTWIELIFVVAVPIAWVCHNLPAPKGMEIRGANETDIASNHLPIECRGAPAK